jgi:hypothetical protein
MREISEDTCSSIKGFMRGLNTEQISDYMNVIVEKQPYILSLMVKYHVNADKDSSLGIVNFVFAFIVRCYEYEYGEFPLIADATLVKFHDEKRKYMDLELNRKSQNKVISGLRREAGQRKLLEFIDGIIQDNRILQTDLLESNLKSFRVGVYMTILLLNEELEKQSGGR